jgi:hypothetical protein
LLTLQSLRKKPRLGLDVLERCGRIICAGDVGDEGK